VEAWLVGLGGSFTDTEAVRAVVESVQRLPRNVLVDPDIARAPE